VEEERVGEEIIEVEKSDVVDLSTDHDSRLLISCSVGVLLFDDFRVRVLL
jgi:hypothetical protein